MMMRVRVFLVLLVFVAGAGQAQTSQEYELACMAELQRQWGEVERRHLSADQKQIAMCKIQGELFKQPICKNHSDVKYRLAEAEACSGGGSPSTGSTGSANGNNGSATSSNGSATPSGSGMRAAPTAPVRKPSTKREPRGHVKEAEASHCLKPLHRVGGGVVNDCPFSIEYSYCVERPTKGSWSEQFECGKDGGSWQVGAGPGKKSIMHTAGAKVHWFACKYRSPGATKPDGISPAGVTYVPGRGLVGRCAEWGAK